jgi:hypothetical protein
MAGFELGGEPPGDQVDPASLPRQVHAARLTGEARDEAGQHAVI